MSRVRKVALNDYARHLLCYRDGRFGCHPRWRFFVFNLLMRRKANAAARFYVSKASGLKDLNREELADTLLTDDHLLPQIVRQGSALMGTCSFWRNKSNHLYAQARFLSQDMSPVFITFSCADMQWQDLHRHFPGWSEVSRAGETVRRRFIWDRVQDQPHLIAHYLTIRRKAFMEYVVGPLLNYEDHWDRDEWQVRGSGHNHGLFWIPGAPFMDMESEESRRTFAVYWGERIVAHNPDPSRLPDARNPASLAPANMTNTPDQFAAFLNRLQVHTCRPQYCLRVKHGLDGPPTCRFFYPRKLLPAPVVTKEINNKSWLFAPARNQAILNQCSAAIAMGWMANTDIQPPTSLEALLSYITKYVSKPEKASTSYQEMQAQILPHINDRAPLLSFVSRMLNKVVAERDWSAQEVSHILLQLPVQSSSWAVVSLDCRPENQQANLIVLESGEVSAKRSVLQRYRDCLSDMDNSNAALQNLSLFQCLRFWDGMIWKLRPCAKPRVINYFPRYKNNPRLEAYSDYCRVKLILHHPFVNWDDLLSVDGQVYTTYVDAFRACIQQHVHPEDFYTDLEESGELGSVSDTDSDISGDEGEDIHHPLADFEILARRRPQEDFPRVDVSEGLSYRDMDRDFNWPMFFGRYNHLSGILDQLQAEHPVDQAVTTNSSPGRLNPEQR